MLGKSLSRAVRIGRTAIVLAALAAIVGPQPAAAQTIVFPTPSRYYWSYAVKFVCGMQPPLQTATGQPGLGEPVVKPGNYATEINIHNFMYREVPLRKKIVLLVEDTKPIGREPESQGPRAFDRIVLKPDWATMDDCNRIWQLLNPNAPALPAIMPLMIGYLVIISPVDLDVDAVYTAEVPGRLEVGKDPTGISIDVERINGKRAFIPDNLLPPAN
jgi:hypothetical protein